MSIERLLEGLNIINKYVHEWKTKHNGDSGVVAEHVQLWIGCYEMVTDEKDIKRLEELDWFEDENSWSCYV